MYRRIRRSELNDLAAEWHFSFDDAELDEFFILTEYVTDVTTSVENLPQFTPSNLPAHRDPGHPADQASDPYNAVVRWCTVRLEGATGPLSGKRIGLKDSIGVAGIPITGGSNILTDFVPEADATVVRRILEAGGEIVAMLNMDYMAFSGGGESSAYGPTLCPFDTTRTAAGSSGGSGAALFYDDIDITLGCDQGGSIRAPGAWSGVIGLKPTFGLVPYTGILGIDLSIDHVGPMARTAEDAAVMLQVIAGKDPEDPRQPSSVPTADYVQSVRTAPDSLKGLRIAVVKEGFGPELPVEAETVAAVREVIAQLETLGADITEVSIPENLVSGGIAFSNFLEGMGALMAGGGNGFGWSGFYSSALSRAAVGGLKRQGDMMSAQFKLAMVYAAHMRRHYGGELYAKSRNLHPWLRAAYDRALEGVDMLVMPTMPNRPHQLDDTMSLSQKVMRGWAVLGNTVLTNITGHPAMTMPAAEADGLPIGVMFIGHHFEDHRLLSLASTWERRFGWRPAHPGDPRR